MKHAIILKSRDGNGLEVPFPIFDIFKTNVERGYLKTNIVWMFTQFETDTDIFQL
jgi:hypothetical protein